MKKYNENFAALAQVRRERLYNIGEVSDDPRDQIPGGHESCKFDVLKSDVEVQINQNNKRFNDVFRGTDKEKEWEKK